MTVDGLEMLRQRMHLIDEGPKADAYSELIAEMRQYLDSFACADPTMEEIGQLRHTIEGMRRITDARAVPEMERPFGSGRQGTDSSRAQCMSPDIRRQLITSTEYLATVTLGEFYLGMNNAVHGGVVAVMFDEALGRLASHPSRLPCRTAYLNTTYRAITPIGRPLELRARLDHVEGRKHFVSGELVDGEVVCATADALFLQLKPGQA